MARKKTGKKPPLKWFAPSLSFFLPTHDGAFVSTGLPLLEAVSYEAAVKAVTQFVNQGFYQKQDSMYVSPIDGTPVDIWHINVIEIPEERVKRYEGGWRKSEMIAKGELPVVPTQQGGVIIPLPKRGLHLAPKPALPSSDSPEDTSPPDGIPKS